VRDELRGYLKEDAAKVDKFVVSKAPEEIKIVIPGIDTEKGLALYGGEREIYLPLLRSYVSNTPKILEKLNTVTRETLPDYVIAVHGLKGANAGIGAQEIREAALNLETLSRAGDLAGVLAQNGRLIKDTEIVVTNIKAWLERHDACNIKPRLKAPDKELLARLRQSCEAYDMLSIDKAMSELESADYEENSSLVTWLKEKINISEFAEVAQRLRDHET
jgi:HPt (histidine-containing phosphotransfer) domain-containing protein